MPGRAASPAHRPKRLRRVPATGLIGAARRRPRRSLPSGSIAAAAPCRLTGNAGSSVHVRPSNRTAEVSSPRSPLPPIMRRRPSRVAVAASSRAAAWSVGSGEAGAGDAVEGRMVLSTVAVALWLVPASRGGPGKTFRTTAPATIAAPTGSTMGRSQPGRRDRPSSCPRTVIA